MFREHFGVSKDNQAIFSTSQSYVKASRVAQETNALVIVGTDTGEDDKVLFTTLEGVDRSDFDFFVIFLLESTIGLHRTDNVAALAFIRGDDTNIGRLYSG